MSARVIVCLLLPLFAGSLAAQGFPTPGEEHKWLASRSGTWTAAMEIRGEGGDWMKTEGTETVKMVCGGMWQTSTLKANLGPFPFEGRMYLGYDQTKKKYVGTWVDSMSSSMSIMEGTFDKKTQIITMQSKGTGPDGKPMNARLTTEIKGDDHAIFKMYAVMPDGKEVHSLTINYKRVKTEKKN